MAEQISDVIRAKRFELVGDDGTVRATLGFEKTSFEDHVNKMPMLALMDEAGEVVTSISLDYFNHPRLFMRTSEYADDGMHQWHSVALEIDSDEARLVMQGAHPKVQLQDRNEITRVLVDLSGGDEGNEPNITVSDNQGKPRLEVALDEVVRGEAAEVGGDFEVREWFEYTPRVRVLDVDGNVTFEAPEKEGE